MAETTRSLLLDNQDLAYQLRGLEAAHVVPRVERFLPAEMLELGTRM